MSSLTTHQARTPTETEEAAALVTRVYQKAGYVREGETSAITAFLSTPATTTITARTEDSLIGTISVIADSSAGLPMDSIFKDELRTIRESGRRIAEVGQFAVLNPDPAVSMALFKAVFALGVAENLEVLCITVNPKHESFYRTLGFEQFADTRSYSSVGGAPAVPMKLDLKQLQSDKERGVPMNALLTEILR